MQEGSKNNINKNEIKEKSQSLFAELEEQTKHLNGASKAEQKMRILERKGFIIPQGERIRHYVNYILEKIEQEPEENKMTKILDILEKDGIFTKEELEILIIGKQAIEKGEILQKDEKEIENLIKNDQKKNNTGKQWLKKTLLLGALLLAPLYNKNKEQNNKEKIKTDIGIETPTIKTTPIPTEEIKNNSEKIPTDVKEYIEILKNLDFIKGNFYVLDKSNKKSPTLYQTTKEGKVISKAIVGIGKEGHETKSGLFIVSKWLQQEDINIYGEDGVLRLLGYSINGDIVEDMGIHKIYPLEEKERALKMLNKDAEKGVSLSCINVFDKYYKEHIMQDFEKQGGEGKLILVIMQEREDFDTKQWKIITQKIKIDVDLIENSK